MENPIAGNNLRKQGVASTYQGLKKRAVEGSDWGNKSEGRGRGGQPYDISCGGSLVQQPSKV